MFEVVFFLGFFVLVVLGYGGMFRVWFVLLLI